MSPPCLLGKMALGWALTLVWKTSKYLFLIQCDCTQCVLEHVGL